MHFQIRKRRQTCFDHSSQNGNRSPYNFDFSREEHDEVMQKQFLLVGLATISAWNVERRKSLFSFFFSYIQSLQRKLQEQVVAAVARRAGFRFAETVLFSSIPCFLFVSRCSVHHSAKNAPLLSIRAFDTAENEFLQVYLLHPFAFLVKI